MSGPARAVHQFVPALIPRDATGSHTLLLRDALRSAGWRSEIFAEATHDELTGQSVPVERYGQLAAAGDVLVYQFSTSSMVADLLATRDEPLILDYHNVTDPALYAGWDDVAAERSTRAYAQLALLAPRAQLGLAVSAYNEADLRAAGCRRTAVVAVLADHGRTSVTPDRRTAERLAAAKHGGGEGSGADWLFVGRMVPSKAQHQLVKALWAYRRLFDRRARLHLVGAAGSPRYQVALRGYIEQLGLTGAVRLTGGVSDAVLAAYLQAADVYVSASLHEGFGVPLLEAMAAGVPVVAVGNAAVPETVAGGGLVLGTDQPAVMATAVRAVLTDRALHQRLVVAGHQRVAELSLERAVRAHLDAIATVAGPPPATPRAA